jgi:hypothetical protein
MICQRLTQPVANIHDYVQNRQVPFELCSRFTTIMFEHSLEAYDGDREPEKLHIAQVGPGDSYDRWNHTESISRASISPPGGKL